MCVVESFGGRLSETSSGLKVTDLLRPVRGMHFKHGVLVDRRLFEAALNSVHYILR